MFFVPPLSCQSQGEVNNIPLIEYIGTSYFGGYVNKNLIESQIALNFSMDEVKTLIINSFKSSFLKEEEKKKWIKKI